MLLHAEELRYQSDTHAQKYDQACVGSDAKHPDSHMCFMIGHHATSVAYCSNLMHFCLFMHG